VRSAAVRARSQISTSEKVRLLTPPSAQLYSTALDQARHRRGGGERSARLPQGCDRCECNCRSTTSNAPAPQVISVTLHIFTPHGRVAGVAEMHHLACGIPTVYAHRGAIRYDSADGCTAHSLAPCDRRLHEQRQDG
jgi:hypothetical protein